MKHSTYKKLYQAHLGVVDEKGLLESRKQESDPFYRNLIDLIVSNDAPVVQWDVKPFTSEFLSGSPRERLDETFFAFVLRVAAIIKEESYVRTYQKPESHNAVMAWISILRGVLCSSLALLYNVEWTPESIFTLLEPTITKMIGNGDGSALRRLLIDLGITPARKELYPAERSFEKLNFLQVLQFGSFYWRFLHWMAEAVDSRGENMAPYKKQWRELLKGPLYRTVRCQICMVHFSNALKEFETQLMDPNGDLSRLFFTLHNRTHAMRRETNRFLQEPDYTEDQYKSDSEFMRQALST